MDVHQILADVFKIEKEGLLVRKSHDAHIMLHYLLQVVVKNSLPKNIAVSLIRLGNFFQRLCSKVISL